MLCYCGKILHTNGCSGPNDNGIDICPSQFINLILSLSASNCCLACVKNALCMHILCDAIVVEASDLVLIWFYTSLFSFPFSKGSSLHKKSKKKKKHKHKDRDVCKSPVNVGKNISDGLDRSDISASHSCFLFTEKRQ